MRLLQRVDPSAAVWITNTVLALALMTDSAKVEFYLLLLRNKACFQHLL